ncbi:MAG: hypothetical protein JSU96_08960 [Acidobacteriota bacterium]|nr:MAG: hypothetical protein JSU96_08960 [Acidobacteriota bacterium]
MGNHSGRATGGCCGSGCLAAAGRFNRRQFMLGVGAATAGSIGVGLAANRGSWPSERFSPVRLPLRLQPVLVFSFSERREATSWRPWGGLHTQADVNREVERIGGEMKRLLEQADFPLQVLPLVTVSDVEQARLVQQGSQDVVLMYAAGGWVDTLEALVDPNRWTLVFLRHKSGPVSLWYEIVSNRFLRKTVDEFGQPGVTTRDVVVDRIEEVTWRLRALAAVKNTMNKKILCVGGASGWGEGGRNAPDLTRHHFGMDLVEISYDELGRLLLAAREDRELLSRCREAAEQLIQSEQVSLESEAGFVEKAFLLTEVFHRLLAEHKTDAITINLCMGTIIPHRAIAAAAFDPGCPEQ